MSKLGRLTIYSEGNVEVESGEMWQTWTVSQLGRLYSVAVAARDAMRRPVLPDSIEMPIEQPALGSAGAVAAGEVDAFPTSSAAPIEAPGQAREDGVGVPTGRRARATVAPPSGSSSARQGTPAPATDAAGSDQPKEEGDAGGAVASEAASDSGSAFPSSSPTPCPECGKSIVSRNLPRHLRARHGAQATAPSDTFGGQFKGNVIDEDCPGCGRHFTWRPGLLSHQRGCEPYLEAATAPDPQATPEEQGLTPGGERPAPWIPEPPAKADSVIKNGRERWLCSRCSESFNTPERRDEHQRFHPAVPVSAGPVGAARRSEVDQVLHPGARS